MQTTRSSCRFALLSVGLFLAGVHAPLHAQAVSPAPTPAVVQEAVVLSPFEVNSQRDQGFVAASALAGGRLAIDLKDNPAAYSVLTNEFIAALEIKDVQQSTRWSVNTNLVMDNGQNELSFGGLAQTTIRGVTNLFVQRNFFPSKLIVDTYNAERLDFGRGPNAVLYGFSSFGGTQNVMIKEARLGRNFAEVKLTASSWDDYRQTIDANYVFGEKNVAMRVNALHERKNGWHDHEWDQKNAFHVAGKWQITKDRDVRADYEKGRLETARAFAFPNDQILGWDGVSTYTTLQQNTGAIANNAAKGVVVYGNLATATTAFVLAPAFSTTAALNLAGTVRTSAAQGLTPTTRTLGGVPYVGNNVFNNLPLFGTNGVPYSTIYSAATAGSNFRRPDRTAGTAVLDNRPTASIGYYTSTISLTEHLGNFYIEGVVNQTLQTRDSFLWNGGLNAAYIDLNRNKPDGSTNPYFLQPYSENQQLRRQTDMYEEQNARVAAAYVLDAKKWGKYTLNAMVGLYRERRDDLIWGYFAQRLSDPSLWTSEPIAFRYYWNETSRNLEYPNQVNYTDASGAKQVAKAGWMRYLQPNSFNTNQGFRDIRGSAYKQVAARGSFLEGKLNLLASYRTDRYNRANYSPQHNYSYYGINWDGVTTLFRPQAPSQSFYQSLTYQPKNANGSPVGAVALAAARPRDSVTGAPLPQYLNDKFQDDYSGFKSYAKPTSTFGGAVYSIRPWLNLALNYSQGLDFNDASNTRYNGQTFGPRTAKGYDVSLRFNLLNDRLYFVVTGYKGKELGLAINDGGAFGNVNTILSAPVVGNLTLNAINGRGIALLPGVGWDLQDRSNRGLEFEVVANITRSWRLTTNLALPKSTQDNSNSDFRTYYDANQNTLKTVLADAGIIFDSNGVASLDPAISNSLRPSTNAHTNAVNAWNSLQTFRKNVVPASQPLVYLNKMTANIFTDYTIPEGRLKNLRVGGGINYRGKQVIGYRGADTIADTTSAKTAQGYYTGAVDNPAVGPFDVVYQSAYFLGTLTLAYKHTIHKVPVEWNFVVDNVFDYSKPIYYNAGRRPINGDLTNPGNDTVPTVFNYSNPRNYTLSMTVKF